MNMQERHTATTMQHSGVSEVEVSKLFRNTYTLLAITLAFSALVAYVSMSLNLPYPGIIVTLVGFYGLLFLTTKLRNSGWGLAMPANSGFCGCSFSVYIFQPAKITSAKNNNFFMGLLRNFEALIGGICG